MISNHSFLEEVVSKGEIVIEDVWTRSNTVVLSGVHIGIGATINIYKGIHDRAENEMR